MCCVLESIITYAFLLHRLSGFQLPSSIVSTGSILTLCFTTDFAVSAQGFKAIYEGKISFPTRSFFYAMHAFRVETWSSIFNCLEFESSWIWHKLFSFPLSLYICLICYCIVATVLIFEVQFNHTWLSNGILNWNWQASKAGFRMLTFKCFLYGFLNAFLFSLTMHDMYNGKNDRRYGYWLILNINC